jgi:hypothetical protein
MRHIDHSLVNKPDPTFLAGINSLRGRITTCHSRRDIIGLDGCCGSDDSFGNRLSLEIINIESSQPVPWAGGREGGIGVD